MQTGEKSSFGSVLKHADLCPPLPFEQSSLSAMVELSEITYWEMDADFCLNKLLLAGDDPENDQSRHLLGKPLQELGVTPLEGEAGWNKHWQVLHSHAAFDDFQVWRCDPVLGERYYSISGRPVLDDSGVFCGYRGIFVDCTEKWHGQRLLKLERAVIDILLDTSKSRTAISDAIQKICESEQWEAGRYWAIDTEAGLARLKDGWSVDDPDILAFINDACFESFKPGEGLVGNVWQSGKITWISDLNKEARLLRSDTVEKTQWKNGLLFPVMADEEVIGIFCFMARHIPEPGSHLLQVLRSLGIHMGLYFKHREAEEALRESEERFASTVELAPIGIAHVADDGTIILPNRILSEMLGYNQQELTGKNVRDLSHPEDRHLADKHKEKLLRGEIDSYKLEKRFIHKNGEPLWVSLTIAKKWDRDGKPEYDISMLEDISARREAEERIQYLATHDEMTGLPNRSLFNQLLSHAIDSFSRYKRKFAVVFIDLDRFKQINDSLGHEAGDELLKIMSQRLRDSLRSSDIVARLGGDEFIVMLEEVESRDQVANITRNLLNKIIKPMKIMGHECRVTASIGICMYPENASDAKALMKRADMAMYQAKEMGKNNFQFFNKDIQTHSIEKMQMEAKIRSALERKEFEVYYQAKVNAESSQIQGVEALLRWNSPELGQVSPGLFIPIAEEMGMIVPIGKWVIQQAVSQCRTWQDSGLKPVSVSVNLSPRQFLDNDLVPFIEKCLNEFELDPALLEIEITESMVMHNVGRAIHILARVKKLGVKIAIDDFGTGYSSLSQLKRFPIDTLKVDRSFIREIENDSNDQEITRAIITMGKTLGMTVVAEGVENDKQQKFLKNIDCDQLQGFYFSKPSPVGEFTEYIRNHQK